MNEQEIIYSMALTRLLPYQSQVQQTLLDVAGSATALYEAHSDLKQIMPEASDRLVSTVSRMGEYLKRAEEELEFANKKHIRIILRDDVDYPARLRECPDAPIVVFYRGNADLNCRHILSIVGTRQATEYGHDFCAHFLHDLAQLCPDVLVVSGLAYGIDICAHRQSLANHLPTIGVLAHGLDQIYPRIHRQTAIDMLTHGGLLTEFMSGSTAEKLNFVSRNRIVAGMSDAVVVVESAEQGGSLITAELGEDYGRDVFAVPGRIGDAVSAGCNMLIRNNRASLLLSAQDFVESIGWVTKEDVNRPIQRELFPELTEEEMRIYNALKGSEGKHLNTLTVETNLPIGRLSSLLFDMEMRGIVRLLSGGSYRLV
ncbi:MAG: DNA-processing protein DprA [Bacteroidaceae bacterium]|nr:DNA-processing protein DprA [Bacteroidaceae bacterium]